MCGGSALSETSAAFNTFSQHSIHQIFTKCLLCAQGTVLDPEDSDENKVNSVLQWKVGHIQIRYIKDSLDQGRNTSSPYSSPITYSTQEGRILTLLPSREEEEAA